MWNSICKFAASSHLLYPSLSSDELRRREVQLRAQFDEEMTKAKQALEAKVKSQHGLNICVNLRFLVGIWHKGRGRNYGSTS